MLTDNNMKMSLPWQRLSKHGKWRCEREQKQFDNGVTSVKEGGTIPSTPQPGQQYTQTVPCV